MQRVAKVVALFAWYGVMGELGLWALVDQGAGKLWPAIGCLTMVGIDTAVRKKPSVSAYVDRRLGNAYAMSMAQYEPPAVRYGDARLPAPPRDLVDRIGAGETIVMQRQSGAWSRPEDAPTVEQARVCCDAR